MFDNYLCKLHVNSHAVIDVLHLRHLLITEYNGKHINI